LGVNRTALQKRIAVHDRVLIDTSVFIAYFSIAATDATHDLAAVLIDEFIGSGRNSAVFSPVTALELLVRPLQIAPAKAAHVHAFLTHTSNLSLLPMDLHVAQEAATLKATHAFKVPDAMVIATGVVAQVKHLVTNDKAWRTKLTPIRDRFVVTYLYDYLS